MSQALLVSIETDACVRQRAAEDLHVQHAGQHDVVDVVALAADEAVVLDPLAAGAEPTDLDLVECPRHGVAPSVHRVACDLRLLSFLAAHSTDFTMFW